MRSISVALGLAMLSASASAQQSDRLVGSWQGSLRVGAQSLRIGVIVERGGSGALAGSFVSIDQGGVRVPATLDAHGDTLVVTVPPAGIRFDATLSSRADAIAGVFTQGQLSQPLTLVRVAQIATRATVAQAVPQTYPSHLAADPEIRALLAKRIDQQQRSFGIVVGVIEPSGRRVVGYGHPAKDDARSVDGKTVFEIGSVTKTFTSLVLADMVAKHEVSLDDPVAKYLPNTVHVPSKDGRQITLADLSTHTSGLPRLPTNFAPRDSADPYADYSNERLFEFLSTYKLPRAPGAQYEYSNLGAGVLGVALSRRAGTDYETLVRRRVLEPLHLDDTRATVTTSMQSRFATGYATPNRAAKPWTFQAIAGAGALRSTVDDMLSYVAANLGDPKTPLAATMASMTASNVRRPTGAPSLDIGLAWHILAANGHEIIWHDGGTGGFRSFIGFDRTRGVGIVVLSNSGAPEGVDDIGLFVLTGGGALYEKP